MGEGRDRMGGKVTEEGKRSLQHCFKSISSGRFASCGAAELLTGVRYLAFGVPSP